MQSTCFHDLSTSMLTGEGLQSFPCRTWYEFISGAMWMNIMTLACPDKLSARSCVSLELRKGTWRCLAARAAMTSPRAESELLMWFASTMRSPGQQAVDATRHHSLLSPVTLP